jgi:hypothetical protein
MIEAGIVDELTLLGVLRHISPPARHSTQPLPHSSFVLSITRNPVAKTNKIPYSFALVGTSRGFQFPHTHLWHAVSARCKECAVVNRAIVPLDSTRGIHVHLCFFCISSPMYVDARRPLSNEHSRMFIKKISKSVENGKPCEKLVCSAILVD